MKKIPIIVGCLMVLLLSGCSLTKPYEKSISSDDITPIDVSQSTTLGCEEIISSSIEPPNKINNDLTVTGKLRKGQQNLSVSFENEKVKLITGTSVKIGNTDTVDYTIVKNDQDKLLSINLDKINESLHIFALNKKSGLAIWSKTDANYFIANNPVQDSYYLQCI